MAQIKFGTKQLKHPTPANIGRTITIASAVLGATVTFVTTASFIPNNISNIIASILGFIMTLCNVLRPFFGVKTEESDVPINEVTEMETEQPKDS